MDKLNLKLDKNIQIISVILLAVLIIMITISFFFLKDYTTNSIVLNHIDRFSSTTKNDAKSIEDIMNGKSKAKNIENVLDNELYSSYVINADGTVIYNEEKDHLQNVFDKLSSETSGNKVNQLEKALTGGDESGNLNLKFNNMSSNVCYVQIDRDKGLYLLSVMPKGTIIEAINGFLMKATVCMILIIVVLVGICIFYYLTTRKYNQNLKDIIYKDTLTGERSYAKFLMDAEEMLKQGKNYAIYYADIKNFKYINDTYGYEVGDKLLIHISNLIKTTIGKDGIFARIAADSFTAMFEYENKDAFVEEIYKSFDDISDIPELKKENYKVEAYVGVYCTGDFDCKLSISEILDRANMAQKTVKGSSEFHLAFYNEEIRQRVRVEKDIEKKMETALKNGEFVVFYQPKYDVRTGEIAGAEALVRWDSPENGFLLPGKFIPLFEQNGFIVNLDQYVFESVCKTVRDWLDKGKKIVTVSINVSRVQFYRLDFVKRYTKIKNKYNIPDGLLELEFTESIVFENIMLLQKIVNNLKSNGFMCSIDDFGSGYSSLNVLKSLPMDVLKLDRLFFKDSENLDRDKALIASVVTMARALKMKTVSEGIETWNQVNFLKEIGCDIIQGYVYSEPVSLSRFEHLIESKKRKMPVENEKVLKEIERSEEERLISLKNLALLQFVHGTIIEVDVESGEYQVMMLDEGSALDGTLSADNFEESCLNLINDKVHPDDQDTVKERCISMGILSSFYQGVDKIITDFRLFDDKKDKYEWYRSTLLRLKTDNPTDFKAVYFIENIENIKTEGTKLFGKRGHLDEVITKVYSMIYEFSLDKNQFKLLYYNKKLMGDQPEIGEVSWVNEYYISNFIHPDDRINVANFLSRSNVYKQFEAGKEKISIEFRHVLLDKSKYSFGALTIVKSPSTEDDDVKFLAFCENVTDRNDFASEVAESNMTISSAIKNYYDAVLSIDLSQDTYEVMHAKNEFSDLPQDINYSELVNIWIKYTIHPNDRDKVRGVIETSSLIDALNKGKAARSCAFRYIDRDGGYRFAKLRCIRLPAERLSAVCLIRDINDSMDYKDIFDSDIDSDPLKRLYKKESAEIMINKNLTTNRKNANHAFILLDINDIESLSDGNTWQYSSKDDVLNELSESIVKVISKKDIILRTSGYEFTILLKEITDSDIVHERSKALCKLLRQPIAIDGMNYKITGNIGVSLYPSDGSSYDELYMSADLALYKAKIAEEDSYKIYEKED